MNTLVEDFSVALVETVQKTDGEQFNEYYKKIYDIC